MGRDVALAIKRVVDIFVASAALMIALPLFLLIGVAIKVDSPGPVFFRQQRAGQYGKPFRIVKFRSMTDRADEDGPVTALQDARVTRVGRFLRLSSLDELPQLLNVLRSEMSLVGPRPLLPNTEKPTEMRRLEMKPGITGLTQVRGRQLLTWDERMTLDLWYVEHWNLALDFSILLETIPVVLKQKGVYDADGEMKVRL